MRKFWNDRYDNAQYAYGLDPNDFLVFASQHLPTGSKILSLGEGEGRNALFLAKAGHDVVAVDQSDIGMAKAQKIAQQAKCNIETIVADLADFNIGNNQYDAIISIFCHVPVALRKLLQLSIKEGLREGGLFITEAYAPEQLQNNTGGPKDRDMLVSLDEIINDFADFEQVHAYSGTREVNEGEFHHGMAVVTQYIGRKP